MNQVAELRVADLRVHFALRRRRGNVRAVDGVSFSVGRGEMLALVGASGCGKTTVARTVALLQRPTAGRLYFQEQELTRWRGPRFNRARRRVQMLFSNPYRAFAPRMTVNQIIREALQMGRRTSAPLDEQVADLMDQVGLNYYLVVRYPRDLSGGQRQRLALARALAVGPTLLVCDQPAAHLERAMGRLFHDLLHQLNQQAGLTMLVTSRDLASVRHAHRAAVMVQGRIVEMGYTDELLRWPLHPFTQHLVRSPHTPLPALDPLRPASGCAYEPLCPLAEARCRARYPAFVEAAPRHGVACHLVSPLDSGPAR